MANSPTGGAPAPSHYSDTAARTFEMALQALEESLPEHHEALKKLFEDGRIDDVEAIRTVLEGRKP